MADITKLPTATPVDNTPVTYSGTRLRAFLLPTTGDIVLAVVITNTASLAEGATTAQLSAASATFVPSGSTITFGGVALTTAADVTIGTTATAVTIAAAPAAVTLGATTSYTNLVEIPIAEELNPTITDMEESINVHGRITPIRNVNGKDMTATIRTLAAIDNPVVKTLIAKAMSISPNNRARVLWLYDDGFALLATVNIGAPTRQSGPNQTLRAQFSANLSGKAAWADLTLAAPVWNQLN